MAAAEVMNLQQRSRSASPEYEDYEDIPEVLEEYEDIPVYSGSPEYFPDMSAKGSPAPTIEPSLKLCQDISSPSSKGMRAMDENFDANKENLEIIDPDAPECMQGSIGVKALRAKLNSQISCSSPNTTPGKACRTPTTTREVRSHFQPAAVKLRVNASPAPADATEEQKDENLQERFPSPPIRKQFEEMDAVNASAEASIDGIGGLQMSSEHSEEFGVPEELEGLANQDAAKCEQLLGCLQVSDSPSDSPERAEVKQENDTDADDNYIQLQRGTVDVTPSKPLSSMVKVFSEGDDDHDSKRLTSKDHARANLAAMNTKCTAWLPAPPPKVQGDEEETEVQYSNEEIEAIADVLLNPAKTSVAETSRQTPSKINEHLREALTDIHYSPSPRASSMLQKFRQKEAGCTKVPTPNKPKGSILGLQPGRSLMPVLGLQAANMAALATVKAAMSPHRKNNTQHSRRSKMPSKGQQAADRAALAEVTSSKTRKLALFHQPELSAADQELQKKKWSDYVAKYGKNAEEKFEEYEDVRAPIIVPFDDSMDVPQGAIVVDGLQESINGLQASFSSEEGEEDMHGEYVLENDTSIYTSFTQENNDDSDDEIFPEQPDPVDYQVEDKVEKIHKIQGEVEEMGRKVMVLQQRVNKSRRDSQDEMQQTSARQLMGDASTPLEVEDLTKVQKILDIFDVISQTVCDSEENQAGSSGSGSGNKLMAEIVSLRAGQLALIQDDHDQTVGCVEEVKKAFYSLGYRRCHGLLDRVVTLTLMEKTAHSERKTRMEQAAQLHSQEAIKQHHGKRGDRILLYARESLKNSRFDHALAFIVKAKRAYGQSDRENAAEMLEDLNRTVVMEATRMASDSLILEATRKSSTNPAPRRNSSGNLPSLQPSTRSTASDMSEATVASEASTELQDPHSATPREKDEVEALFSPSDATSKLFERIDMGGKVTLSQEQVELEDEIQRLRAGLEAKKSQMQDDVVPLHRKSYDAPAKPPVAMSSPLKPAVDDTPNVPSNGAGKPLSVETLLSSSYAPVDKELAPPISARKESRISWDFPDIDQALLKATNVCDGGMVGTAMVFLCLW